MSSSRAWRPRGGSINLVDLRITPELTWREDWEALPNGNQIYADIRKYSLPGNRLPITYYLSYSLVAMARLCSWDISISMHFSPFGFGKRCKCHINNVGPATPFGAYDTQQEEITMSRLWHLSFEDSPPLPCLLRFTRFSGLAGVATAWCMGSCYATGQAARREGGK